jgi:hypothetical protein
MKLFVPALVVLGMSAAVPAMGAQEYVPPQSPAQTSGGVTGGVAAMEGIPQAAPRTSADQSACPLTLTSASVAPEGRVMPVSQWTQGDGTLRLHFQNQSRLPVQSVALVAHLKVKADAYALDARELVIPLTFAGTKELDRPGEHSLVLALPHNFYLYGVARVSVDSITFTTGEVWKPASAGECGVNGHGADRIEAR